ncbi:MAG: hypothetical protein CTY19_10010 [Methylomonas sp.]|nr:MAG: hypothetical protein CTY19_10010 [Methylomonas sp.]
MKNTKTPAEKPATATKTEAVSTPAPKAAPKKTSTAKPAAKKSEVVAVETQSAPVTPAAVAEVAPKKPTSATTAPKKPQAAKTKPAPAAEPELAMAERVGLTAGSIWHYLSENGATSVAKLLAALDEEEKIIQRSIGWLALEDKISIDTDNRIETISLKS